MTDRPAPPHTERVAHRVAPRVTVATKPKGSSSTLWLNGLTILSLVLGAAAVGIGDVGISELAQARVLFVIALVQPAINYLLRLRTHEPLAGTTGERKALAESTGAPRR